MSVLIRCRAVCNSLQKSVSKMHKSVKFVPSSSGSETSFSSADISEKISKIKSFIPVLKEDDHKGSNGRIGIVGGSVEYTGAPYFAGIAALRLGADLVHVFCCKEAAIPIKCYSPELMIHPILDDSDVVRAIEPWLKNLHVLVIGPGLGKSTGVMNNVSLIIKYCKQKKPLPLVIDADGLHLLSEHPGLIKDYKGPVILTPNANEFNNLVKKVELSTCHELSAYFNAVIVKKGPNDLINNGMLINICKVPPEESLMVCEVTGSYRRCGGQGDILAGFIGTFVAWYEIYLKNQKSKFNFETEYSSQSNKTEWRNFIKGYSYAAYGGCFMTRTCSNFGFRELGRSLTSSDIIQLTGKVFAICFDK